VPKPRKGETLKHYLGRAIPMMMGEGRKQSQSVAIAYSMFRHKGKKKGKKGK
jgi:hypothetical protein